MSGNRVVVTVIVAGVALMLVAGCRPTGPTGQAAATAVPTRVVGAAIPTAAPTGAPTTAPPLPATATVSPPVAATVAPTATPPAATGTPASGGGGGAMGAPANVVAASLGAATGVRVGQSVWVADAGVQVEVVDLLDSRCPPGVNCVRAGEVKVTVRVSEGGRELGTATLASAPKDAQSKTVGGYTVTLLDVQPPKTLQETPKGDYVLTVRINRG